MTATLEPYARRFRTARRVYDRGGVDELADETMEFLLARPRISPKLYWTLAPAYYRRRCADDAAVYEAPLAPFKLEWVDPDRIVRHTRREYPPYRDRMELFGTVRDGEWDRRRSPPVDPDYDGPPADLFVADRFEESVLHRSMEAHFVDGVDWERTELYEETRRLLEEGDHEHVWHLCRSEEDLRERFRELDALDGDIRRSGFHSQRSRIPDDRALGFRECIRNEITVDVGRDGELLLVCGKHRLSIAKIRDVDAIPVLFLVRHPEWMDRRDSVYASGKTSDHPDLRDVSSQA